MKTTKPDQEYETLSNQPVFETTDYGQFKTLLGNRAVNNTHVNKLIASIIKQNMLAGNPIIVTPDKVILDGQHRLIAAKALKLPVYYVQFKGDLTDVQLLNTNAKTWTSRDYLDSYCALGRLSYIQFRAFITENDLTLQTGLILLTRNNSAPIYRLFREGGLGFDGTELNRASDIAKYLGELREYIADESPGIIANNPYFVRAFLVVYNKDLTPILLKKLSYKTIKDKPLVRQGGLLGYIRQFEDILNRGDRNITRLV